MKPLPEMYERFCLPCESCRVLYTPMGRSVYCAADKRPVNSEIGLACNDRWREPGSDDEPAG